MTITQRFYPKTLETIFRQGDFFTPSGVQRQAVCTMFLFKTDSGIEWDPERLTLASTNEEFLELLTKVAYSGGASFAICSRTGTRLNFLPPDFRFEVPNDTPFRHGVICLVRIGAGAQLQVYSLLHVDFGEELNPERSFELKQNPACIPHIQFEPIACEGPPAPIEYSFSGAKIDVKSGEFSLMENLISNFAGAKVEIKSGEFSIIN